ncbi:MAG: hypothetical protein HOP19_12460 [Acidobacteria bacterium]|nr:hypothetical protein [Acidobacteriota bacterium]
MKGFAGLPNYSGWGRSLYFAGVNLDGNFNSKIVADLINMKCSRGLPILYTLAMAVLFQTESHASPEGPIFFVIISFPGGYILLGLLTLIAGSVSPSRLSSIYGSPTYSSWGAIFTFTILFIGGFVQYCILGKIIDYCITIAYKVLLPKNQIDD